MVVCIRELFAVALRLDSVSTTVRQVTCSFLSLRQEKKPATASTVQGSSSLGLIASQTVRSGNRLVWERKLVKGSQDVVELGDRLGQRHGLDDLIKRSKSARGLLLSYRREGDDGTFLSSLT